MSARTPRLASLRQRRPGTIAFEAPWKGPRRTEGYYSQLSAPRWRSAGHCLRLHLDLGLRCVVPSGERSYRRLSRHMDDLVAFRFQLGARGRATMVRRALRRRDVGSRIRRLGRGTRRLGGSQSRRVVRALTPWCNNVDSQTAVPRFMSDLQRAVSERRLWIACLRYASAMATSGADPATGSSR
jgi:hypothetical protein